MDVNIERLLSLVDLDTRAASPPEHVAEAQAASISVITPTYEARAPLFKQVLGGWCAGVGVWVRN